MTALKLFAEPGLEPRPLRPHQVKAMAMIRESIRRGNRRIVVAMPTGAGKTRLAAEIVNGSLGKGNKACFTVPAVSLVDQTVEAFEREGIDWIGVIQASHPRLDYAAPVQVASVQTLARRKLNVEADVVVIDEAHLQFESMREWMRREPEKVFIGLSATPWARGMADDWQDLIIPVTMQELIDAGYLSPFLVYAPSHPDLDGVRTVAGDYHEGQLSEAMGDSGLIADVVETWRRHGAGRPTLVFAVDRGHAVKIRRAFENAGIAMGYCDAFTDRIERKVLFDQVAKGKLAGIVNISTLTTGVDADIRCIVMARPTKSEMLFVQCIGRGLRTAPGKDNLVILDHSDNHARLGFVTDIHHTELLSGNAKKSASASEKGEPAPRECASCGALRPPAVRECPACGFAPERQSEIEFEDGELVEITSAPKPVKLPKHQEATKADKQRFWSEALGFAASRGRQRGWAAHTYRARFGVWPRGLDDEVAEPSPAFINYEKSRRIAWLKAKGR